MSDMIHKDNEIKHIDALLQKALDVEQKNTDEALKFAEEAFLLAKKGNFALQKTKAHVRIGRCLWIKGSFDEAIKVLNEGIDLSRTIGASYEEAESLIALGNVYVTINLVDQAINQYNNALAIINEYDYPTLEAKILNNIGTIHEELNNYDVALDYYRKSVDTTKKINDEYGLAIAKFNTGNMYLSMGQFDKAKTYIEEAVSFSETHHKVILNAHSNHALGKYYQEKRQFNESIKTLKKSLDYAKESNDLSIQVTIYLELARSHDYVHEYDSVEHYFDKAYHLAQELRMDEIIPRIHEELAEFYQKNNDLDAYNQSLKAYFEANKRLEDKRRKERLKSIEYQSKLKDSINETESYKSLSAELKRSYNQMHVLSEIGQSLTSVLNLNAIFEQLYEQVNRLMDGYSLGVGLYDRLKNAIQFDLYIENNKRHDSFALKLDNKKSWNVWTFTNKRSVKIDDISKEFKHYIEGIAQTKGEPMSSAMYTPLVVEDEAIGVLTVQSKKVNAYTDTQEDLFKTLAAYLAIAIKNAQKSVELEKLNQRLKRLSEQDGLTGVPNRRMFNDTYLTMWNQLKANKQPLAMMFIDVDHFKEFNDTYGHLVGDEVIKAVAKHLEEHLKHPDDFVARYGGDEFVLLSPNITPKQAKEYADVVHQSFKALSMALKLKETLTVSVGCGCIIPSDDKDAEKFLDFVDKQLYKSKNNGRNKVTTKRYQ